MKKLLLITILSVILFSCSKDDQDNLKPQPQTRQLTYELSVYDLGREFWVQTNPPYTTRIEQKGKYSYEFNKKVGDTCYFNIDIYEKVGKRYSYTVIMMQDGVVVNNVLSYSAGGDGVIRHDMTYIVK
jgi:energy-converting hydrogenase Eha subunit F